METLDEKIMEIEESTLIDEVIDKNEGIVQEKIKKNEDSKREIEEIEDMKVEDKGGMLNNHESVDEVALKNKSKPRRNDKKNKKSSLKKNNENKTQESVESSEKKNNTQESAENSEKSGNEEEAAPKENSTNQKSEETKQQSVTVTPPPKEKRTPKPRGKPAKKVEEIDVAEKSHDEKVGETKPENVEENSKRRQPNKKQNSQNKSKDEVKTSVPTDSSGEPLVEDVPNPPTETQPMQPAGERKGKKKQTSQPKDARPEKPAGETLSSTEKSPIVDTAQKIAVNTAKQNNYTSPEGESTETDETPTNHVQKNQNGKRNSKKNKSSNKVSQPAESQLSEMVSNLSLKESSLVVPPNPPLPSAPTKIYSATTYYKDYETNQFLTQFRLYLNLSDALKEKMRMIEASGFHKLEANENGAKKPKITQKQRPPKRDQKFYDSLYFRNDDLVVDIKEIDLTQTSSTAYDGSFFHSQVTL